MKPKLTADEQTAVTEKLGATLNGSRVTSDESVFRFIDAMNDAYRSGLAWPEEVRDIAVYEWVQRNQKNLAKRESVVLIDHEGRVVGKATRVGSLKRAADGKQFYQQQLLADLTWGQLVEWMNMARTQIGGWAANLTMGNKLLGLRDQFPDTAGPHEACERLGTTVEEFLTAEASS